MEDCFLSANQEDGSLLCLAPLTNRQISASDIELSDGSGVFLYQQFGQNETTRIKVIARVLSEEAALMLQTAFKLA